MKPYLDCIWSNKNYRLAICLSLVALLWLLSGLFKTVPVIGDEAKVQDRKRMSVRARYVDAQQYQPVIHVRARTEANREVSLRAELSGKVIDLPVNEGQAVAEGDVICELAMEDRELRYREAQSAVAQTQLEYDGSQRLKSGGYQSRTAIASARARLDAAKANFKRSELNMANVKMRAPFDGLLDRHSVEVGDFMDRGDECGTILDLNPLIISGRVSETQVGQLTAGSEATARLLTGQQVDGTLVLVGYGSGSVTRTFRVEVEVDNSDLTLRSGITTDVSVPVSNLMAHLISSSLLSLDDAGKVGVRVLSEDHRVEFFNVELVGDHTEGIWVTGLPARVLLVTVGQEYISHGEWVDVTFERDDDAILATQHLDERGEIVSAIKKRAIKKRAIEEASVDETATPEL